MTGRQLVALGIAERGRSRWGRRRWPSATSAALSPLTPIGYARELEPHPALPSTRLPSAWAALPSSPPCCSSARSSPGERRDPASRDSQRTGRVRAADALAGEALPAPVVTGVRLALARGAIFERRAGGLCARRRHPRCRRCRRRAHVLGEPPPPVLDATALRAELGLPERVGRRATRRCGDDRAGPVDQRRRVRRSTRASFRWRRRQVGVRAMRDVKGSLPPTVIEGAPRSDDEILLGTKTLRALGLRIGDTVEVRGAARGTHADRRSRRAPDRLRAPRRPRRGCRTMTWSGAVRIGASTMRATMPSRRGSPQGRTGRERSRSCSGSSSLQRPGFRLPLPTSVGSASCRR